MDEETRRLMRAMAARAAARDGFIGHKAHRWERGSGFLASDVLGGDADALTRLQLTPMPAHADEAMRLAEELGLCAPALRHILFWREA